MLTQNQLNKVNQMLENKVFNYNGEILMSGDIIVDFDYKLKLTGYRKFRLVGEWTDYIKVDIDILKFNNPLTEHLFEISVVTKNNVPFYLKHKLDLDVTNFLSIFDDDIHVFIDGFNIKKPKSESLTESNMSRLGIRTVVRDITNILKKGKRGFFYLPDEDLGSYSFTDIPFEFNVELTLKTSKKIDGYQMNGYYSNEDDVIEIVILFNPLTLKQNLYNMIGELNEIFAHELEHGFQEYKGEFDMDRENEDDIEDSLEYYTQEHEIPAQYKGFKRLSKLRKEPFPLTVKNWFDTHKEIHGLNDEETEKVINMILAYKP